MKKSKNIKIMAMVGWYMLLVAGLVIMAVAVTEDPSMGIASFVYSKLCAIGMIVPPTLFWGDRKEKKE